MAPGPPTPPLRAPGASAQTFLLSSPPPSAGKLKGVGPAHAHGAGVAAPEGQMAGVSNGGDVVNMIVPINPFLSSSRDEGGGNMGRKTQNSNLDASDLNSVGSESQTSFDQDNFSDDETDKEEVEKGRPTNLSTGQFKFKTRLEFGGLMSGLEKAVITSNVNFINVLQPDAPAFVSKEEPDIRRKVLVDIHTAAAAAPAAEQMPSQLQSQSEQVLSSSRDTHPPSSSSMRRGKSTAFGTAEDETRSVSFAVEETEVNGEGEEMNDLASDSHNYNGNNNKAMPTSLVESALDVSNDPCILPANEELFQSLMGAKSK